MMEPSKRLFGFSPMIWAWGLLVAVTMLAWWIAEVGQGLGEGAAIAVILTACLKIWVIGHQFMELHVAPPLLRYGFLLWVIVIGATLSYLIG